MSKKLSLAARLTPILPPGIALPSKLGVRQSNVDRERGVPFFRDPTHTGPTLRLYRQLLRATGPRLAQRLDGDATRAQDIRWALKASWKATRPLTSIPRVRTFLERNLTLLSQLSSDSPEDLPTALEQLSKTGDHYRRRLARQGAKHARPLQPTSRLTGGFLRPGLFNPPLPRLKPQPENITMMIHHRLRARENRQAKFKVIQDWGRDMKHEMAFYRDLHFTDSIPNPSPSVDGARGRRPSAGGVSGPGAEKGQRKARQIRDVQVTGPNAEFIGGWDEEFNRTKEIFHERFAREHARAESKYSEKLVERVKEAKRGVLESKRQRAERRKRREASPSPDQTTDLG